MLKTFYSAILLHCITAILSPTLAGDLGTHGIIYPIEEQDPIALIQQKLKKMEETGELERRNKELQQKTKVIVERPKPVEGMTKAQENRTFYYDPTYVVKEDLKDHTGKVFVKKGTKINLLETISLSYELIFVDGDDDLQIAWAKEKLQECSLKPRPPFKPGAGSRALAPKVILVKGAPLSLSKEWKVPVYFDQGGFLVKKLGIHHVPALVTQVGFRLRIEEIKLGEKQ